MALLLRGGRRYGGEAVDVLIDDGRLTAVAPPGAPAPREAEVVDLDGRFVGPGLWDAHVHFTQWVAARARFDLATTTSAADAAERVRARLAAGAESGVLVGYGFRDALWPDQPSVTLLDAAAGTHPVVLVSGDLHCGWLNTAAAAAFGLTLPPSGLLRETEWIGTLQRIDAQTHYGIDGFRAAADAAAARGVVGVVDFENDDNLALWPQRVAAGVTSLRVDASVWPSRLDAAIRAGHRSDDVLDQDGLVRVGPLKVVADGSLNTRTAYCWQPYPGTADHGVQSVDGAELRRLLRTATGNGIDAAVHAIGDRTNTEVLDAFEELAIPGTIEHAQLVRPADVPRFARLGVVASVQPEHAMDDRDVADRHWAGHAEHAFAYGSLHAAGAVLRLGSDAPVAPLDPWVSIAAAVHRHRDGRAPWHPEQRLPIQAALAASARGRGTLTAGDPADLVVVEADPLTADEPGLRAMTVAATLLGGRWTWRSL
ncbi:amidohydrolase [Jiangella anatolica]|uniref:Amidohydrolase 3 domain-containing protein n=1 Tax=Jiangella anatolica TaxID=2670374 RepID=A0A2W2D1A9_9ACTN|nr:amidohydrolase family protein [Jiangella anatolica]PZF86313.1 hypothetical protein C1I92_02155 [Jiangella anatolica]